MADNPAAILIRSFEQITAAYAEAMRPVVVALAGTAANLGAALQPMSRALADLEGLDLAMPDAARHLPGDPEW